MQNNFHLDNAVSVLWIYITGFHLQMTPGAFLHASVHLSLSLLPICCREVPQIGHDSENERAINNCSLPTPFRKLPANLNLYLTLNY